MRAPCWLGLSLVFVLWFLVVLTSGVQQSPPADSRIRRFQELIQHHGASLPLSLRDYLDLVLAKSREYNVALIIVAGASFNCESCNVALDSFTRLAKEYQRRGKMEPEQPSGKVPTFFVQMDVSKDTSLIQLHALEFAPVIAFINPPHVFEAGPDQKPPVHFPAGAVLKETARQGPMSEIIYDFINREANEPGLTITKPMKERVLSAVLGLCFVGAALWVGYKSVLLMGKYPSVTATAALLVQLLATSGLCWSVINGFRWFGYDARGNVMFFSSGRRHQFAGEGIFMSTCIVASGMLLYAAGRIYNKNTFNNKALRYFVSLSLALCGFFIFFVVTATEGIKKGAQPSFFPPDYYIRGPLRNDRGNSF